MRKRRTYENYFTAEEIAYMTENSVPYAYKLIQKLNGELEA